MVKRKMEKGSRMKTSEFMAEFETPRDRREMIESLASVIISSSPDLPESVEEQDNEILALSIQLSCYDNNVLLAMAREVNIVED